MSDAPDYEHVINTEASAMSDAPDWQDVAVEPGGGPIGGGGGGDSFTPSAFGFLGWSANAFYGVQSVSFGGNGRLTLALATVAVAGTVKNLTVAINVAASSVTANENFLVMYQPVLVGGVLSSLNLLGATAAGAYDSSLTVVGYHTVALASPVTVTANQVVYLGFITTTTGSVSYACGSGIWSPYTFAGYIGGGYLPGPYTAPPASVSTTSFSNTNNRPFVAMS